MSWTAITVEMLQDSLNDVEYALVNEEAKAGDDNRVAKQIALVTNQVRGAVSSCTDNSLDADATKIPSALLTYGIDLVVWRLVRVFPGQLADPEPYNRKKAAEIAEGKLKDVATCDFKVDQPDNPSEQPAPPSPSPGITPRRRDFDRHDQEGL